MSKELSDAAGPNCANVYSWFWSARTECLAGPLASEEAPSRLQQMMYSRSLIRPLCRLSLQEAGRR